MCFCRLFMYLFLGSYFSFISIKEGDSNSFVISILTLSKLIFSGTFFRECFFVHLKKTILTLVSIFFKHLFLDF